MCVVPHVPNVRSLRLDRGQYISLGFPESAGRLRGPEAGVLQGLDERENPVAAD